MKFLILSLVTFFGVNAPCYSWGFYAHKQINQLAVFALPVEMFPFYKRNIGYITEHAVDPDKRRYLVKGEDIKHYIDLDYYEKSLPLDTIPFTYKEAVEKYGKDSLHANGIVPWNIQWKLQSLSEAFATKNEALILKISAELGHYIADAHVPLHTTSNYNGQQTGQHGIHGFFETRLPELYMQQYDFFIGTAEFLYHPLQYTWEAVSGSYQCLDSVFYYERLVQTETKASQKYVFEPKGATLVKVYSPAMSEKYHLYLRGMVERRMRAAVYAVSCFWYTAWVNGGQPNLDDLTNKNLPNQDSVNLEISGDLLPQKMIGRQEYD
jgi:hypothetical protein